MHLNCHQFDCVTFFPPFHILVRRLKKNDCRDQILNFIAVRNSSSAGEKKTTSTGQQINEAGILKDDFINKEMQELPKYVRY